MLTLLKLAVVALEEKNPPVKFTPVVVPEGACVIVSGVTAISVGRTGVKLILS